jgi:hypothetical protein
MSRYARLVALLIAATLGGLPAAAATLGNARVGFTAERVLVLNGRSYIGRMWNMPGKQRFDQTINAFKPVFILRADRAAAEVLLPQLHTEVQFPFPPELAVLRSPHLLRRPEGRDIVNGIATTRYAIDESVPQGHAVGTLWLSRDGIPMKLDGKFIANHGKPATIHWELRHVRIGPQPAALFEVPPGYSKLPPEAVAPLLGLRVVHPPAPAHHPAPARH